MDRQLVDIDGQYSSTKKQDGAKKKRKAGHQSINCHEPTPVTAKQKSAFNVQLQTSSNYIAAIELNRICFDRSITPWIGKHFCSPLS